MLKRLIGAGLVVGGAMTTVYSYIDAAANTELNDINDARRSIIESVRDRYGVGVHCESVGAPYNVPVCYEFIRDEAMGDDGHITADQEGKILEQYRAEIALRQGDTPEPSQEALNRHFRDLGGVFVGGFVAAAGLEVGRGRKEGE